MSYCISSPQDSTSFGTAVVSTLQMDNLLGSVSVGAILFIMQLKVINSRNTATTAIQFNSSSLTTEQQHELEELLNEFVVIFQTPFRLPPSRSHDH